MGGWAKSWIDEYQDPAPLLAKMLGRSNSGVSLVSSELERAGLIEYDGAEITIVDRERLQGVTCSCYWLVRRATEISKGCA